MSRTAGSSDPVLGYVRSQRPQRTENSDIVLVIRAQLKAIALGNLQRQFQRIDGIKAQSGFEQRRLRIDIRGSDAFQIQRGDNDFCELTLAGGLRYGHDNNRRVVLGTRQR